MVGKPLVPNRYTRGFEYSDCFVDDARLVVLTARDAADRGADIRTRSRAVEIRQADGIWHVTVENALTAERSTIQARALVNAALDGRLEKVEFTTEPAFGLSIPVSCPGDPAEILHPRSSWADNAAYDRQAADLAARFEANFQQFDVHEAVCAAGPGKR